MAAEQEDDDDVEFQLMQVEDANSDSDQRNHHQLDNEENGDMIDAEQIDKRANVLATAFQTIIGTRQPLPPTTQAKAAVSPRDTV